jgi:hypothetical protein
MGYAFPKMNRQHSALNSGILLGVLWGGLALAGDRVPRHGRSPRHPLVLVFCGFYHCHDGHKGCDRLGLYEYEKCVIVPVPACKLHGIPGYLQSCSRNSRPGNAMVFRLCRRLVGGRGGHRPKIWETIDATGRQSVWPTYLDPEQARFAEAVSRTASMTTPLYLLDHSGFGSVFVASYRQSNCFLVGFGFTFSLIEVQPISRQSSVVCLIHWRSEWSCRNARRIQSPK